MPSATVVLTPAPTGKIGLSQPSEQTTTSPSQPRSYPPRQKLYRFPPQPNSAVSPLSPGPPSSSASCPKCGFASAATSPLFPTTPGDDGSSSRQAMDKLAEAQRQIDGLQEQMRLLNDKAVAAVEKSADYEDEVSRLRRDLQAAQSDRSTTPSPVPPPQKEKRGSFLSATPSGGVGARLSALWSAKSTPNLKATQDTSPPPPMLLSPFSPQHQRAQSVDQTTDELLVALTREQNLRLSAEAKFHDASREVEELSVSLFEQANEMVASERRARAKLEERVELLEKRDVEKRDRLARLEAAVERIERVKRLLDE